MEKIEVKINLDKPVYDFINNNYSLFDLDTVINAFLVSYIYDLITKNSFKNCIFKCDF